MPKTIFKFLWDNIKSGKEVIAFVKNKTKDGDYYWVEAQVTPSFDSNGKIIGYHSVRRRPKRDSVQFFDKLYKDLISIEKQGGADAGLKYLSNILDSKGVSYEQFILTY
jgi:hypothetical protein